MATDTVPPVAPKLVTGSDFNFLVDPQVTMQTNYGTVVFELNPEQAPITVANMLAYIDANFYDGTLFHRVMPGFVVQGGGFEYTGHYKIPTYGAIKLESDNGLSNLRGTIAMARTSDADSATTQFYINHADNTSLDYSSAASPGYAAFGEVVSGMPVIDSIAQVPTTTSGAYNNVPVSPVVITAFSQTLAGSSITNTGLLQVSDLEAGAAWDFSLDGGSHWTTGSGSSFDVPEGIYAASAIQVRQIDEAGNTSLSTGKLTSALEVDMTAPDISAYLPADAAAGVAVFSNLVVIFNDDIQRGTGAITLKTAAGATVASYDAATSANLSFAADRLTIDPSVNLAYNTHYTVEFAAGAIKDLAGNSFAGAAGYDFTTASAPTVHTGTAGNDVLAGSAGDDAFTCLAGNDMVTTGLGNDIVDGGDGVDTIRLPLFPNAFDFSKTGEGHYTAQFLAFTALIDNVEYVEFGSYFQTTLPIDDLLSGAVQGQLAQLTDLYLAFFGRAPDVSGLEYWQEQLLEVGKNSTLISMDFSWSTEAQALFPLGESNHDFVRTVYQNCFGRDPDAGGWSYWTDKLDALDPNGPDYLNDRGAFVGELLLGAYAPTSGEEDRSLLINRHEVAMSYVNKLAVQPEEGFDPAINELLAMVNLDNSTRSHAEHVLEHVFNDDVTLTGVMNDPALLADLWAGS